MNKAVFLDRDGVINKAYVKEGKPYSPRKINDVEIIEGVVEAIFELKAAGFEIVVVTNQPDVARRKIAYDEMKAINDMIMKEAKISYIYVCPHDDYDNCVCRKPRIGLFLEASRELKLDLNKSFMVGDRWKDIEAGQLAGCNCFFINYAYSEKSPVEPYIEVESLQEATKFIVGNFHE
jgi:D-glycero-D-manno-heptose 1,7-bisphosphate phosphatase